MAREHQKIPIPTRRPDSIAAQPQSAVRSNSEAIEAMKRKPLPDRGMIEAGPKKDLTPKFKGFENKKFQLHDERIEDLVAEFNKDKASFIGANPDQVANMDDLSPALVKSWAIQETAGRGAPWAKDPIQANNPGDWDNLKKSLGLKNPGKKRNTGDPDTNMRASIALLARKGFSTAVGPPSKLRGGQKFGGWKKALTNYNGNNNAVGKRRHKDVYTERIMNRAEKPDVRHRVPLGRRP